MRGADVLRGESIGRSHLVTEHIRRDHLVGHLGGHGLHQLHHRLRSLAEARQHERALRVTPLQEGVERPLHVVERRGEAAADELLVESRPAFDGDMAIVGRIEIIALAHVVGYAGYLLVHVGAVLPVVDVGIVAHEPVVRRPVLLPGGDEVEHVRPLPRAGILPDEPHPGVRIIRSLGNMLRLPGAAAGREGRSRQHEAGEHQENRSFLHFLLVLET